MSQSVHIFGGHVHSMCFLFVRGRATVSDRSLLKCLGLEDYEAVPSGMRPSRPHVFLDGDDEWLHLADDLRYSLCNRGFQAAFDSVANCFPGLDVFGAWAGDCDYSFGFAYRSGGGWSRNFEVWDYHFDRSKRDIVINSGKPLAAEFPLEETGDPLKYVLSLAESLGVRLNHTANSLRCYAGPKDRARLLFNAITKLWIGKGKAKRLSSRVL